MGGLLGLNDTAMPIGDEGQLSDDTPSANFTRFEKYFPKGIKIQLVKNLKRVRTTPSGIEIRSALKWQSTMDLSRE
jgi:hypothetical protein